MYVLFLYDTETFQKERSYAVVGLKGVAENKQLNIQLNNVNKVIFMINDITVRKTPILHTTHKNTI
jgi:hypothetical protein